jgi:aspartyl-tRNA(Asn)/glutamyl-tRNA(Gln) amidotransferase subunit C
LDYVQQLDNVDVSGIEPTYQVTGLKNIMRDDKLVDYGETQEELLKNAPSTQDAQFKVKRVL